MESTLNDEVDSGLQMIAAKMRLKDKSILCMGTADFVLRVRQYVKDVLKENDDIAASEQRLVKACKEMLANIDRWLDGGPPADAVESKRLYDQMKAAVEKAEATP